MEAILYVNDLCESITNENIPINVIINGDTKL